MGRDHDCFMKVLIATKNPGKFSEIREMLGTLEADFVSLSDIGISEDFIEEGASFAENAQGKARFYACVYSILRACVAVAIVLF